jgi:LysM repeat protein
MNNPNPFVPKGSLLEQQNQRRIHLKLGVYCVLAVSCAGLMAMLIQGCKQKENPQDTSLSADNTNNTATTSTPDLAATSSNTNLGAPSPGPAGITSSNPPVGTAPIPAPAPQPVVLPGIVPPPEPPVTATGDYTVVKGDSLAKIAKKVGVTLKALQDANKTVQPTKLKIGQKLVIPAGGKTTADATTPGAAPVVEPAGETYTVKSGDTLTKIAKANGVKVKALQTLNGLTTTQIKVGQKLKLPAKAEAPAAVPAAAPDATTPPAAPAMPAAPTSSLTPVPPTTTPAAPAHN